MIFTSTTPVSSLNITTLSSNVTSPEHASTTSQGFTTSGILKALSVAVLIVASLTGNLIVCISFMVFRNLRSMTNYFLVSLSVSDMLIACCTMPLWMLVQLHQPRFFIKPDDANLLLFWYIMDIFLCLTSVMSLAAISVERNLAISQPFYYTKWMSPTRVYITIASLWMFSLTVAVVTQLNVFGKKSVASVVIVFACYVLPMLIILSMYGQILLVARRQARRLRQDGALATDFKAIKTIAIVIGTFFVCYTPFMVIIIWVHFGIGPVETYTVSIVRWLTYLNSCVNPIIYSCSNKTYRRGFKRLFQMVANKVSDFRVRASNNKARKLQQSRSSLNMTMRSSAGSLLDGGRSISVGGQSRGSVQSVTQNAASFVEINGSTRSPCGVTVGADDEIQDSVQ